MAISIEDIDLSLDSREKSLRETYFQNESAEDKNLTQLITELRLQKTPIDCTGTYVMEKKLKSMSPDSLVFASCVAGSCNFVAYILKATPQNNYLIGQARMLYNLGCLPGVVEFKKCDHASWLFESPVNFGVHIVIFIKPDGYISDLYSHESGRYKTTSITHKRIKVTPEKLRTALANIDKLLDKLNKVGVFLKDYDYHSYVMKVERNEFLPYFIDLKNLKLDLMRDPIDILEVPEEQKELEETSELFKSYFE